MADQVQNTEELKKSMDQLIEEFFAEEEATASEEVKKSEPKAEEKKEEGTATLEKASDAISQIIGEPKQAKEESDPNKTPATLADSSDNNIKEKSEDDEKNGKKRGRPNDLSQMSMRDMSTGESKGSYDASIAEAAVSPAKAEDSQVSPPEHMKKAETVEISKEEYEALKKSAEENKKAEELKKAEVVKADTERLVKSAVESATAEIRKEKDEIAKKLEETTILVKSFLKQPKPRKSISSVAALEKGGYEGEQAKVFSKSEMLDAAEELVKSKELTMEDVIELENTGTIHDKSKRAAVERKLRS
jgi:hypothetical protein